MNDLIPKSSKKVLGGGELIPHPSETCGVSGCENETAVVVLLMRGKNGKQKAAEQPSWYIKRQGEDWYMKPDWKYDQWVTRCSVCYGRDYERYTAARA